MIQEIVRQPGLFKLLTGTNLKGAMDPSLDNMKEEIRKKLQRLEALEQKGFDIKSIRDKILREHMDEEINLQLRKKERLKNEKKAKLAAEKRKA